MWPDFGRVICCVIAYEVKSDDEDNDWLLG